MTVEEKLSIARGIITPLLRKIQAGMIFESFRRHILLFFTRSSM